VGKGIAAFAVLVASLLLLAGCGDDSSTISQQEYEQQLELACNRGLQEREKVYSQVTEEYEELSEKEATPKVEDENLLKLIDVYQETTEEIDELGVPEGNEEKAEELVKQREEAAAKVQADPQGTRNSFGSIFEKSSDLAESFGAKACAV
jgi:hypothetical protein